MKNIAIYFCLLFSLTFIITFSSCTESDLCDDINCFAGGTCDDGKCDCTTADGFEGEFCQTEVNKKFTGFSALMESCNNDQPRSINISLTPSNTSPTKIRFDGLVNGYFQADGFIDGAGGKDFVIPRAVFGIEEIEGNGTISNDGNTITLSYSVYDQGDQVAKYTCTGALTK